MRITTLFKDFFESEKAGGLILMICTLISLALANSAWGEGYIHFWHSHIGGQPIEYWINDGLMTIFFSTHRLRNRKRNIQRRIVQFEECTLTGFSSDGRNDHSGIISFWVQSWNR